MVLKQALKNKTENGNNSPKTITTHLVQILVTYGTRQQHNSKKSGNINPVQIQEHLVSQTIFLLLKEMFLQYSMSSWILQFLYLRTDSYAVNGNTSFMKAGAIHERWLRGDALHTVGLIEQNHGKSGICIQIQKGGKNLLERQKKIGRKGNLVQHNRYISKTVEKSLAMWKIFPDRNFSWEVDQVT